MTDGRVPLKSDISNLLNSPVAFLAAEFCQSTTVFDYIEVNQKQWEIFNIEEVEY